MKLQAPWMSETEATRSSPGAADATAPRFSWPMRIFLAVLLFDVIFRSLTVLVPWEDWCDELQVERLPWRLPTQAEMRELCAREPTPDDPAPLRNRLFGTLDSVWDYLKPWPSAATRTRMDSWGKAGQFGICWLSSRFEFFENVLGINEEWPMFSPNVSKHRTLGRTKLLFEDGSTQTVRLTADPPDLTHYSHWFEEKVLDYELRIEHDWDAREGYGNFLAHRYPVNAAGSPLRAIFFYTVEYDYPSPNDDAAEFLRVQNGPPLDRVGPVFAAYDVQSRRSEQLKGWPAPSSALHRALGDLANVPLELDH